MIRDPSLNMGRAGGFKTGGWGEGGGGCPYEKGGARVLAMLKGGGGEGGGFEVVLTRELEVLVINWSY